MIDGLVTVIVPVYNAEGTLSRCLSSILNQTYEKIEVIVIDDGSTDYSSKICDLFANKDNRVSVVHIPNAGVCAARNLGLSLCNGEYVAFVDSDDYIDINMIETMVSEIQERGVSLVFCGVNYVSQSDGSIAKVPLPESSMVSISDFWRCIFSLKNYHHFGQNGGYLCNKLFKYSVIKNIQFQKAKVAEDELFLVSLSERIEKVFFVNKYFYYYTVRPESLSRKNDFSVSLIETRRHILDIAKHNQSIYKICLSGFVLSLIWYFDSLLSQKNILNVKHPVELKFLIKQARSVLFKLNIKSARSYLSKRDYLLFVYLTLPLCVQRFIYKTKKLSILDIK